MKEKPLALVDLSMHFAGGECLLPTLVKEEVPIGRLLAYSGWNTASNAIGTAVAQGNIVSMRAHDLPQNELPRLYAQNLTFNAARFLDDWAYQKVIRPHMAVLAGLNGSPEVPVSEKSLAGAKIIWEGNSSFIRPSLSGPCVRNLFTRISMTPITFRTFPLKVRFLGSGLLKSI